MSKPVRCARLNKLGGFQYAGTNTNSVKPSGAVNALAQSMGWRNVGLATNSAVQGSKKTLAHMSQT
jgi:hypothetical protein